MPNILASLDVLVLPSYAHEGIPQIILQAQAMSCAVVATTIGGIPEVVKDGVTGLLVPPRDATALAEKIGALLDDPALSARLGQAARAAIEKSYSLDAMGERLLALYEQSLALHAARRDYRRATITPTRKPMPAAIATDCHGLFSMKACVL